MIQHVQSQNPHKSSQPSKSTNDEDKQQYIQRQWKNTNPAFPTGPSRFLIVGLSNTGKTTLGVRIAKQMLNNENDPHHHLVIISPNYQRDDKLLALAEWADQHGIKVRVYTSFDKPTMQLFLNFMDDLALHKVRTLVYVDDPVGTPTFTTNVNQKSPWNSFVTSTKHYKSDIVFSTQAAGSLSKSARMNFDVFVYLPDMTNREELFKLCRFVSTMGQFDRMMDAYASEPYCALWINIQFGRKGVYCINENGTISSISEVPR